MNLSAFSSIAEPLTFVNDCQEENTYRTGRSYYLPLIFQGIIAYNTITYVNSTDSLKLLFGRTVEIQFRYFLITQIAIATLLNLPSWNNFLKAPRIGPKEIYHNGVPTIYTNVTEKKDPGPTAKKISKVISPLSSQMEGSTRLSKTVFFIHDNIPRAARVAMIASSVGLIANGYRVKGASALSVFALEEIIHFLYSLEEIAQKCDQYGLNAFAERTRGFSKKIAPLLSQFRFRFYNLANNIETLNNYYKVYSGTGEGRLISLIMLLDRHLGNTIYQVYKYAQGEQEETRIEQKLHSPIEDIDEYHCEINEAHIRPIYLPNEPNLDLKDSLNSLYKRSTYSDEFCKIKANEDDVLKVKIRKGEVENSPKAIREYLGKGFEKFVNAAVNHKLQAGELRTQKDYDNLRIMIKCCVEKWLESSKENVPVEIQDALFNIGLVGHYCVDGLFRVVESYYASFVDSKAIGIDAKLSHLLRTMRRNVLDGVLTEKTKPAARALLNPDDIHLRNEIISEFYWLAGEPLTFGAQAFSGNKISWFSAIFYHTFYHPLEKRRQRYTPKTICEAINEDLHNGQNATIPFDEYTKWFGRWLAEKHKISQTEGENRFYSEFVVEKELGDPENPDYRYSIKESALLMMLVELGILKVPEDSPYLKK
ncbi:MAG: hypothetical protein SNF33_03005 [Candidatus Algichlamydia australiensis]|nr:hypothetical protein [Chlamydiales bacterium]